MLDYRVKKWVDYPARTKNQLLEALSYINEKLKMNYNDVSAPTQCVSVSPLKPAFPVGAICGSFTCVEEITTSMENTMDYEMTQRDRLTRRVSDVYEDKKITLRTTYHMNEANLTSKDDILAALKAGNIEFDTDSFDSKGNLRPFYVARSSFRLVDPLKDEAGYTAAKATLSAAKTAAKDKAIILPLVDALAALNAFEAATF